MSNRCQNYHILNICVGNLFHTAQEFRFRSNYDVKVKSFLQERGQWRK